jgi:hypothetical protein
LERLHKLMTGDNSQRAHEPAGAGSAISLPAPALLELADLLAQRRDQITAQARAVDVVAVDTDTE